MKRSNSWLPACTTSSAIVIALSVALAALALSEVEGQSPRVPSARLIPAPRLDLPGEIDSSNPAVWDLVDGVQRLFVFSSWGGIPVRFSGSSMSTLSSDGPVTYTTQPGHGVWIESIVPDADGTWYAYFHHERSADSCGRPDRQLPRVGALRSRDRGATWDDLGIIIDAPPGSDACDSANRFVLGGVGDVTAALDHDGNFLYLYFSQYEREGSAQGVAVARIPWPDRDEPEGKVTIWNQGAWLAASPSDANDRGWSYPIGTPLVPASRPFHDRSSAADVFWGPSIHWNTYLQQYVMLLNRAKDDRFTQDGSYVSFSPTLSDPKAWSPPTKIFSGGQWYPQVIGEEAGAGTDRQAGQRARFFILGRSDRIIEFSK